MAATTFGVQGLAAYVNKHADEGKYDSKTLLFCWVRIFVR